MFLLILAQRRLGLSAQLAIDRTGLDPFGLQAFLRQFEILLGDDLFLFWALLARRPSFAHDGTHPQYADDQHGHPRVHRHVHRRRHRSTRTDRPHQHIDGQPRERAGELSGHRKLSGLGHRGKHRIEPPVLQLRAYGLLGIQQDEVDAGGVQD